MSLRVGVKGRLTGTSCERRLRNLTRTYVRIPLGPGREHDQALRGDGGGGAGRGDALRVPLARPAIRGPRRHRAVADRGSVVGGRARSRVLAGGGEGGSGGGPVPGSPGGTVASGAVMGLRWW